MPESSHGLVADNAARIQEILRIIGAGDDIAEGSADRADTARPLDHVDDRSARGTWSAWNS